MWLPPVPEGHQRQGPLTTRERADRQGGRHTPRSSKAPRWAGRQYVLIDPDELDAIAPGRSRWLEVEAFVDLDDIDPVFYQKTYYLAPGGDGARRRTRCSAMRWQRRAGPQSGRW